MKRYIVALYKMITADKWMVVAVRCERKITIITKQISTVNCREICEELNSFAEETDKQADLLQLFKNN